MIEAVLFGELLIVILLAIIGTEIHKIRKKLEDTK